MDPVLVYYENRFEVGTTIKTVKVRIDKSVALEEVKKQLINSKQLSLQLITQQREAEDYDLFDKSSNTLMTAYNFINSLERVGVSFELKMKVGAEVREGMLRLRCEDANEIKLITFWLRTFLLSEEWKSEFIRVGGIEEILKLILLHESGNLLAYSLNLLPFFFNKLPFSLNLTNKLINLLPSNSINITRPTTQSLINHIHSHPNQLSSIYNQIHNSNLLQIIINRITSQDIELSRASLQLILVLLQAALNLHDLQFLETTEQAKLSQNVLILAESGRVGVETEIITFQNEFKAYYRLSLLTPIDSTLLYSGLETLWLNAAFKEQRKSWTGIGFQNEPHLEFEPVGILGLRMLVKFSREEAYTIIMNANGSTGIIFPLAAASTTTLITLCDIFQIYDSTLTTQVIPLLLHSYDVYVLSLVFFHRMWIESNSSLGSFTRLNESIQQELRNFIKPSVSYPELEQNLQIDYSSIRAKELKKMESIRLPDSVNSLLESRLQYESSMFVRQQRINCLTKGSWFISNKKNYGIFYKLSSNFKILHWIEMTKPFEEEKIPIEDLPNKIDLTLVTDISPSIPTVASSTKSKPSRTESLDFFTINLNSQTSTLLTLLTSNASTFSEWLDGLSYLVHGIEKPLTPATLQLISQLTEVGIKIQLLELDAQAQETLTAPPVPPAPPLSAPFHFAEIV